MKKRKVMVDHGYQWNSSVWKGNTQVRIKLNIKKSLVIIGRISLVGKVFCFSGKLSKRTTLVSQVWWSDQELEIRMSRHRLNQQNKTLMLGVMWLFSFQL